MVNVSWIGAQLNITVQIVESHLNLSIDAAQFINNLLSHNH
jgi:hypothetical protein